MTDEIQKIAASLPTYSRKIIADYFRSGIRVIDKADDSPVTIADRETEAALRKVIEDHFPTHGIFGEEHGVKEGQGDEMWVLDPIDGTRSFVCGAPWFGTLIAYLEQEIPTVGVLDVPMMNETWVGGPNGTTFNDQPCATRTGVALKDASLFTTDPGLFTPDQLSAFQRVSDQAKNVRYGTDCYAYGLLASGHIDLVIEAGLQPYDAMALVPVIKGAGGIVTGWKGEEVTLKWDGSLVASGSLEIHEQALELLAKV